MNNPLLYDNFVDGFQSEEELKQQELICQNHFQQFSQLSHKQQVKFKLPPAPEIVVKPYNLYPDTVTGWAPRIQLPSPVPIIFDNEYLDAFIKHAYITNHPNSPLCYLGPRYENTYYAWFNKDFSFPYGHIKVPNDIKFTNRPFNGINPAMNPQPNNIINIPSHEKLITENLINPNCLIFDSFFESGNLDSAIRVVILRVDSNTKGHLQWFNFTVRNMKRMVKYKFHICNFQKDKSLYTRGMKPYIYSKKMQEYEKIGWEQGGQHVRYDRKQLKCDQILKFNLVRTFRLSFDLTTAYDNDIVQIAYCVPYTYSQLCKFIQQVSQRYERKGIVKLTKLCTSLGGLQVPLLIVHEKTKIQKSEQPSILNPQKNLPIGKKCIIMSARAHPGESNSSFMMQGFIQFICGDSKPAEYLRKFVIFKIIPMLNPDGVALGNYRTGLSGKDFNRQFRNPDRIIFPQVYAIKKLVADNKQIFKDNLLMFLDFHGHSIKKNVFMYGPQFPIIQRYYYQCRVFPKLLSNHTEMFRYYSCIFKVSQFKETTARAVLLRKLNIPMTYTIEASNGSYYDHDKHKDIPFKLADWKKMGWIVGETMEQYLALIIMTEKNRIEKALAKKKSKKTSYGHIYRTSLRKEHRLHYSNSQCQSTMIFPIQDEKIRLLYEQIKLAQQHKTESKVSDDELSEGSSDQEGQADDLSPNKVNFLYKIIKNKKMKALSNCRFEEEQRKEQRFATNHDNDDKTQEADEDSPEKTYVNSTSSQRKSFIERNKQRINALIKNELSREKPTAKIINFSFGSSSSTRHQIRPISNRLNLLQACVNQKIQQQSTHSFSNRLVDNTNQSPIFRKTFTSQIRENQQYKIDHKLQTMCMVKNSKRVEDYKLRKIAIRTYKI